MVSQIKVDSVLESTSAAGVTIDGVLIKDSKLASGTGNVLQVVNATDSASSNGASPPRYGAQITSSSFTDTALSASITPSATSSKILILVRHNPLTYAPGTIPFAEYQLLRASTAIDTFSAGMKADDHPSDNNAYITTPVIFNYVDSPSTTSATTYKTQAKYIGSGSGYTWSGYYGLSSMTLIEIGG